MKTNEKGREIYKSIINPKTSYDNTVLNYKIVDALAGVKSILDMNDIDIDTETKGDIEDVFFSLITFLEENKNSLSNSCKSIL